MLSRRFVGNPLMNRSWWERAAPDPTSADPASRACHPSRGGETCRFRRRGATGHSHGPTGWLTREALMEGRGRHHCSIQHICVGRHSLAGNLGLEGVDGPHGTGRVAGIAMEDRSARGQPRLLHQSRRTRKHLV